MESINLPWKGRYDEDIFFDIPNVNFDMYFDFALKIQIRQPKNGECDFDLSTSIVEVFKLISKALGDRISSLKVKKLSDDGPRFVLGVMIKPKEFFEAIIKGPIANQLDATPFRKLWGKKADIRRFQNGDIRETVLWECKTIMDERRIFMEALKYVLECNMKFKLKAINSTLCYFDDLLRIQNLKFNDPTFYYGTGEEQMMTINKLINVLKTKLYRLKLSFKIIEVLNIDPISRLTDVFPPLSVNSKPRTVKHNCNLFDLSTSEDKIKYVRPIYLVVRIDSNDKLSDNIEAFNNQKLLFNYELGKTLAETQHFIALTEASHIDVYYQGFVFRLLTFLQKEISIYRQSSKKTKLVKMIESNDADRIEFNSIVLPAINSVISTLSKENCSYSLTCRIFKRWISGQMMKLFFEDITLDLLVAYSYDQCQKNYPSSNSHVSSFMRLLDFLVNYDFVQNEIILNFHDELSKERIADIKESFRSCRSNFPMIFIVTPYDRKLSYHTLSSPNENIVIHLKKLAKKTFDSLKAELASFNPLSPKIFFKSNRQIFDIVIKLKTRMIYNKYQSMDFPKDITIKHVLYDIKHQQVMPIRDFNPPYIYLSTLKRTYSDIALFFYDEFGGTEIGVLIKPDALNKKQFQTSNVLDLKGLIDHFKILGQDLVESIEK